MRPRGPRLAIVLLGFATTMWIAIGVTASLTAGELRPKAVLAIWPWAVKPKIALAEKALKTPDSADQTRVRGLLQAALAREPVNVRAARSLALTQSFADVKAAERTFAYAENLSRRDLPTQLWLIEYAVQQGNVSGALTHYDRALRTSKDAGAVLLPTLVAASVDESVAKALAPVLHARPSWWRPFLLKAIETGNDARSLAYIIAAFRPALDKAEEHEIARLTIARLVDLKRYDLAARLYIQLMPGTPDELPLVRNGDFETNGDLVPLDWAFAENADISASPERVTGDDTRLEIRAANGTRGEVARQLLVLTPGQYQLSAVAGGGSAAAPVPLTLSIECTSGAPVARSALDLTDQEQIDRRFSFRIPPGCASQWLRIEIAADGTIWLDKVAIARTPK